ncbi:phosphoenolpyruvate carboxykinase [Fusobacterium varium]|uniref:phosphoenolpyruvate carboxykinase n=1 Tax=Fusobacterium varium TaxID=856 RepID=UPI001F45001F|nr:phosphoenolpyruvate carboxykinase [Fusobacterium varium]MCF2672285.1 phosphoenolpyruvate carboxykinase [Fusobacterium varium]UYI77270.1 MAG: phosphoenolpyruvate carboxykinase [Fusobacterium varium]
MRQEATINRNSITINFTIKYCNNAESLLDSDGFKRIITAFLEKLERKEVPVYIYIKERCNSEDNLPEIITKFFKLLIVLEAEEIATLDEKYARLLENRDVLVEFIERLYTFWRKFERYAVVRNTKRGEGLQNVNFIEAINNFKNLILSTYRQIEEAVMGYKHRVYRQLSAGINAGIILNDTKRSCPSEYSFLEKIPFIETIILQPPFITYPKRNTRTGIFQEVKENPFKDICINTENWFCYPAKVGDSLAFIYFNRYFMSQGIALCNLFELAREEEYMNRRPDILYIYGVKDFENEMKTVFYNDKENNMIIGYANYNEDIDYFGYMKKMILTLHNIRMIEKGKLPIHGAMVNIVMKNGKTFNIAIMGDSGAGKSESLEAFRTLSEKYVKDMKVIFDDMGTFVLNETTSPKAYGTEIGAFVRLDDLDTGYAYKEIDRSIFMNPDKINSRIIIPIASYNDIMKGYPIDMFLYANNYEEGEEIEFFNSSEEAIPVFKAGKRMAKGTTSEKGLVDSYFANPFGPVQNIAKTDILIEKFFEDMFKKGVKVGQIRTQLGIKGKEKDGPKRAAQKLFDLIKD